MTLTIKLTITMRWAKDAHRTPAPRQLTNVYSGVGPNLSAIRQQVPQNGNGRLAHTSAFGDVFVFYFKWASSGYDIIIEQQRDYGGRDTDSQPTHRLDLDRNRPRICIRPGQEPRDLPTAILVAMVWAECTSRYIRDGQPW
jgi:hypothetical protein